MSLPLFIARKYISSKQGSKFLSLISVISVVGIAIGTAVLIIALTILDGFENVVSQKIIDFDSHIKITAFGNRNLPDSKNMLNEIKNNLGIYDKSISPYISKIGIIRSKKLSEGITILGIDSLTNNTKLSSFIKAGKYKFNTSTLPGIIIGKKLSEKLSVKVGDKITLFSLRKDEIPSFVNPPAIEQFIVTGIYESGMAEYDDINVYVSLNAAKKMFETPYSISGYNIKLNNTAKIDSLAGVLQDKLRYPYFVRTIFQIHQNIFTWLDLQRKPIPIVLALIIVVAVFNIIGTLLMMVLEKTNSIGILKSLGLNRKQILKIFFYQGLYLALLGLLSGNLIALILSLIQKYYHVIQLPSAIYFLSEVPIVINPLNYIIVSAAGLILSLVAAVIPSYIASKLKPISSIRFD